MKIHKLIFALTVMTGTLITASSYSWMSMWMGLEINLLAIIPILSSKSNMMSTESAMKYFITQAMASLVLLAAAILLLKESEFIAPQMNMTFITMMNSALLTKVGVAPFHYWLPETIEGLSWMNSLVILTWQKIAPMLMIMTNKINMFFIMTVIFLSLVISTISGFNQISLRKIMAFSSINHMAWMLSTMMMSLSMWTTYFVIYSLINVNIILLFNTTKSFYISQINNYASKTKLNKLSFMINFMSLGGLPPFIGFLPKWLVINWMTKSGLFLITLTMIITTLIMLFIYMRIILPSMTVSSIDSKISSSINNLKITIINTTSITSMLACTLIPNFL